MDELAEIKRRKMEEYMKAMQLQNAEEAEAAGQQAAIEMQIKALMQRLLEPAARERLANVRLVKPELAKQVEMLILQLYQSGRIRQPITEEQLKSLLNALSSGKKEWNIKRL